MTIEPLRAASLLIQIHALAAIAAFALGVFQFVAPKGTPRHRLTGWLWVGLMTTVVLTSAGIHEMRVWGPWRSDSPVVDSYGRHAANGRDSRSAASCEAAPRNDDRSLRRRPHSRRNLYASRGSNHARRGFWTMSGTNPNSLVTCAAGGSSNRGQGRMTVALFAVTLFR